MTFLNPFILLGLVAAGIPLAIHLLGKRRPRTVSFSAMVFLEELRRTQFRRLRFRNWLLFALRTLMIVFLVMAFARPAIRTALGAFGERGAGAMVVVLDDGPSMAYEGNYGRRLDWARRQLHALAALVGPNDWAVLLRTSRPDLIVPFDASTIENLKECADWSGDGTVALRHAAKLLGRTEAANRELFIVSDLAGPPWESVESVTWPRRMAAYLLKPEEGHTSNLSVDSLSTGSELVRVGRPLTVWAVIRNTGDEEVDDATVALWIDNRRVQRKALTVPAGSRLAVRFSTVLQASGWVTGRVEVSDDRLMSDNDRWFALNVPPETHLLIVGRDTPSRRRLVALFTSGERNAPYVPVAVAPEAVTRQLVERADVVILNEQMVTSQRAVGWLRDALRRGAGLLVIAGPETDLRSANRRIMPMITRGRFIGLRSAMSLDSTAYFGINRRSAVAPLVADLFVPGPAGHPRFVDYVRVRSSRRNTLAAFTTGDPWIIAGKGTAGRGVVLTAGLNPLWGDFAFRGVVVPLLHRLVNHLARPVALAAQYAPGPGGRRTLRRTGARIELESPDGIRRALLPVGEVRTPLVDLGMLTPTGVWRIRVNGAVADMFAVNLRPAESDLHPLDEQTFRAEAGLSDLVRLGRDPARQVMKARSGTELDIVFLLAALGCMVAEMLLMRGIALSDGERPLSGGRTASQVI